MSVATLLTRSVRLEDDRVVFEGFVESDRGVIEALAASADPEASAHELLHLGARLARLAAGTGGLTELEARVGARLDALAGVATASVTAGLEGLVEQSRALFGAEDGEMAQAMRVWRAELDRQLGQAFDPDHKKSLIAVFERSLSGVLEVYSRRLTAATDPDVPDSPAGRLLHLVQTNAAELKSELATLTLAVGVQQGRTAEYARSAVKGTDFEPLVLDAVAGIAAPYGDVVEHVGRKTGSRGTKKGDILVTLSEDDVPGSLGRYVIEAKDSRLSLAATWKELDAAMANWEAAAAVAVFAAGQQAPTDLPFFYSGERAVVVLDREDPDPAPLALACLFARWVVRRRCAPATAMLDPERVASGIERITRALARVSTIRGNLSTSTKATAQAREHLDDLAAEVREALAELAAEVDR